ncbi:transcription-repair coupling factor [Pseudothermotoga sp.]|uniref:transcription-repair coupling factor n=1 Tax=Pseudothermotoga sp. TaxID=2033661 RepID=UPI0031F683CF
MNSLKDLLRSSRKKPILLIVPTEKEASQIANILNGQYFPDHDVFPFEDVPVSFFVRKNRVEALWSILNGKCELVVGTLHSLSRFTISPDTLKQFSKHFLRGEKFVDVHWINMVGYDRSYLVRAGGEFSARGDVIDIFAPLYEKPVRIELFGEVIEDIRFFDVVTQTSCGKLDEFVLLPAREYINDDHCYDTMVGKVGSRATIFDYGSFEIFLVNSPKCFDEFAKLERQMKEFLSDEQYNEYRACSGLTLVELENLLSEANHIELDTERLEFTEKKSKLHQIPIIEEDELSAGDLVVHEKYGIGLFEGVKPIRNVLGTKEYVVIRYEDATVYVPVERLDRIHKYVGDPDVKIDRLHSGTWKKRLERVREDLRKKIAELVDIYTKRQQINGLRLAGDAELEKKFAETFPYVETEDQSVAIQEVLEDLASDHPMDRLLCGDSGYGKTEVALRATFRCIVSGKQVALLVPTTVLARQHYKLFKQRLEPFGVTVALLDRSVSRSERSRIIKDLKEGKLDVVIGTSILLSENVRFSDLGLVVIDEEQNFGVEQKEKFKKIRLNVNVLSLSATPIPRTLHMALNGMKDMSVLTTPPLGRLPVVTYVARYDERLIRGAILREVNRGGQVIYVHNRVEDLHDVFERVCRLVPEVRVVMAHGQMSTKKLTEAVKSFYEHTSDVIVCTSIMQSGIDVPSANTIIVDDAQRYGLAQLYQLRGRVGRSDKRAFAYFLFDSELSSSASKRLQVIKEFSGPGSGLKIALKDMEIRGIGTIFGFEQHGNVNSIGLNMYLQLLEEELRRTIRSTSFERVDVEIEGIAGSFYIPEDYIENEMERLRIYRRLASCNDLKSLDDLKSELRDRFGRLPSQVEQLIDLFRIRLVAIQRNVKKIIFDEGTLKIYCERDSMKIPGKYVYNEKEKVYLLYNVPAEKSLNLLKRIFLKD